MKYESDEDDDYAFGEEAQENTPPKCIKNRNMQALIGVVICVILIGGIATVAIAIAFLGSDDSGSPDISDEGDPNTSPSTLWQNLNMNEINAHLQQLQLVASQNGNTRAVQSTGFNASVAYVQSQLSTHGEFAISVQPFSLNLTVELAPPELKMISPVEHIYQATKDYEPISNSGAGNVTSFVSLADNFGCLPEDFGDFPQGNIALIPRGNCTFQSKADNAVAAGAVGVLIYNYPDQTDAIRGTMSDPVSVPVFGTSYFVGQSFQSCGSSEVEMFYNAELQTIYASNLIAETKTGNSDSVVVIGAHLDSVIQGPGINDNGSGSSAILQIALQLNQYVNYTNQIRFIWYGAEEEGLVGSTFYVNSLSEEQKSKIALNLNFDMLGSPNYQRGILNGTAAPDDVLSGSEQIMNEFQKFFEMRDLNYVLIPFTGRSDYGPYLEAGIPAGGVETGAELIKDEEGRRLFGGMANTPFDPCYHQACDTIDNVNTQVLSEMAQAAAYVLEHYATADLSNFHSSVNRKALRNRANPNPNPFYL